MIVMFQENKRTHYQRLVYITFILMVDLLFSKAWEIPGCGRTKISAAEAWLVEGRGPIHLHVPWQVLLRLDGEYICGGSIIQPRWILTAAHCLFWNGHIYQVEAFAGISDISEADLDSGQAPHVLQGILHHAYDGRFYDIALVLLATPLVFNDKVSAICQPRDDEKLPRTATATGWGLRRPSTNMYKVAGALHAVKLDVFSLEECRKAYRYDFSNYVMCAGSRDDRGTCSRDSGGPLAVRKKRGKSVVWVQVGVTSFGESQGCAFYPDTFSRVSRFKDWIDNAIVMCAENAGENCHERVVSQSPQQFSGIMNTRHLVLITTTLVVFVF